MCNMDVSSFISNPPLSVLSVMGTVCPIHLALRALENYAAGRFGTIPQPSK